jgi:hypothetical protein
MLRLMESNLWLLFQDPNPQSPVPGMQREGTCQADHTRTDNEKVISLALHQLLVLQPEPHHIEDTF